MPAPIKVRASYSNDSNFLINLKRAVEIDERLEMETQSKVLTSIDALVTLLMHADTEVRGHELSRAKA